MIAGDNFHMLITRISEEQREHLGEECANAFAEGYSAGWAEWRNTALQRSLTIFEIWIDNTRRPAPLERESLGDVFARYVGLQAIDFVDARKRPFENLEELMWGIVLCSLREAGARAAKHDVLLEVVPDRSSIQTSGDPDDGFQGFTREDRRALELVAAHRARRVPVYPCSYDFYES